MLNETQNVNMSFSVTVHGVSKIILKTAECQGKNKREKHYHPFPGIQNFYQADLNIFFVPIRPNLLPLVGM